MKSHRFITLAVTVYVLAAAGAARCLGPVDAVLPSGVKAVWDIEKAQRQTTLTRERISINGLWRWQPAEGPHPDSLPKGEGTSAAIPTGNWGYFKVPGCWPGITDYMQKDTQTLYAHPSWKGQRLAAVGAAWYEREFALPFPTPQAADRRRLVLSVECLNSFATVYVDGRRAGTISFPGGDLDLTDVCSLNGKHVLSMLVVARPIEEVMLQFNDTNAPKRGKSQVARRGLCGDVSLMLVPNGARITDVKVDTSVRRKEIAVSAAVEGLKDNETYVLWATIAGKGPGVDRIPGRFFQKKDLKDGRLALTAKWMPDLLWDIHTPKNMYQANLYLHDANHIDAEPLDAALPVRFGFRELWIDGRDFYLNGSRIFLSALPVDNAQVSAAAAGYDAAKETLLRLKAIGINFVYTHNYGCEPGTHLGFEEILRAADDVGMLVALSQPHFAQYDWQMPDAAAKNGYAQHAKYYVRVAGSHPSVVFYSMSHNATGYADDMNPDMIDGVHNPRDTWAANNAKRALQAEEIVKRLDPGRIVYHHSSGNLGSMHTSNFYSNMAPAQELDDWFEHWATKGVKPVFTCEYMVPCTWDWTMYRGWYKGVREFGSAAVPWEFCVAEWSSQFLGDRAYRIGEPEKRNLRWEAEQFRAGKLWHRWDYPYPVGSPVFESQHEIIGAYLADNWRAFRTWGVSAISPWEYQFFWTLRGGVDKSRKQLPVDWEKLQRPGFSADYIGEQMERMDLAFERSDWLPTADGQALLRNNMPLLAYIAGKPAAFTSKDHNFYPGESIEKQLIIINNSRESVSCKLGLGWIGNSPQVRGSFTGKMNTGEKLRIGEETSVAFRSAKERSFRGAKGDNATVIDSLVLSITPRWMLPAEQAPGQYQMRATVTFSNGETQEDAFAYHVMPRPAGPKVDAKVAVFDPKGQTTAMLTQMGVKSQPVEAGADLAGYDVLVVGKGALTADGPGPNVGRVRDGLKVIVFEQTSEVLEKRFGFRVEEYGLRQVFKRVPDHPILAGLDAENLRDWRGEATLLPPRLSYQLSPRYNLTPAVQWCGIEVPRIWRCGNRGNVASVLIEKPARGDFLPILDGGYSLQYSPLLEYREGRGLVLFCQVDVTGRTEQDPAAETLVANLVQYVAGWKPSGTSAKTSREAVYVGDAAGRRHLEFSGISMKSYDGGHLTPEQVLVVGPGGGAKLAPNAAAVAEFLKAGGNLLALGLDGSEASTFLPFKVTTKKAEHIAATFEPPGRDSLLAGVGPADVHNRDPRAMPLVTAGDGVQALGDGVLGQAVGVHIVFCQFPPYTVTDVPGADRQPENLRRTYRRTSYQLARLLANMGLAAPTPILARFSSPVAAAKAENRWLDGLYLDQPEDWDDPYRFFRW